MKTMKATSIDKCLQLVRTYCSVTSHDVHTVKSSWASCASTACHEHTTHSLREEINSIIHVIYC